MYKREPYTFDRVVRILFTIFTLAAVLVLLNVLKGVLLPFLVSCLIAYMLEPVVEWNMRVFRMKRRFVPVVLTLLEATLALCAFLALVIPYLVSECSQMADVLTRYATTQIRIPYISEQIHQFLRDNVDFEYISRFLTREQWIELIKSSMRRSWSFLSSGLSFVFGVVSWLIVVLYVIFIMLDYERLMLSFKQLVPVRSRHRVFHIMNDIKNAMNRYFRGQFVIAFIVGVLFSVGFVIVGLPMGVIFGLFVGMLNMVPYLQLISLPMAAVLCLVGVAATGADFWVIFWETMAVYIVVQSIQDLVLTPRIMGKAMGLNPAIILLSLSVWGSLLGFMGLIVALPLTTLLLSYYDIYVVNRDYRRIKARENEKTE